MTRIDPTDPLQSIDVPARNLIRTNIARIKRQLLDISEVNEDPHVIWKYFRNMAADYGDGFVIARRQDGSMFSWGCSAEVGQLGDGTTVPVIDGNITEVLAPSAACSFDYIGSKRIGIGTSQGIILDKNGQAWTWGVNDFGQLGDGTETNRSSPVSVIGGHSFVAVGQGGTRLMWGMKDHTASGATGYRPLWVWGRGNTGQLGTGSYNVSTNSPVQVLDAFGGTLTRPHMGEAFSGALDSTGGVWMWGSGSSGKLAQRDNSNSFNSPVSLVKNLADPWPVDYTELALGSNYACAIASGTRRGWCWGDNSNAQLGSGAAGGSTRSPRLVIDGGGWKQVDCGENNTIWLKQTSVAYVAGYHGFGLDGTGFIDGGFNTSPVPVIGGHNFILVRAGNTSQYFGGLKADGSLWMWGEGSSGKLGVNSVSNQTSPVSVLGTGNLYNFVDFYVHEQSTYAMDDTGKVWSWGEGGLGQLGTNSITDRSSPVAIAGDFEFSFKTGCDHDVPPSPSAGGGPESPEPDSNGPFEFDAFSRVLSTGTAHTIALDVSGGAFAWGSNNFGQLGDGTRDNRFEPVIVITPPSAYHAVAAGGNHSLALDLSDQAYTWGRNSEGQLGDGTLVNKSSPITVSGDHMFRKIDGGEKHSIGLDTGGQVWGWGHGQLGQLGTGVTLTEGPTATYDDFVVARTGTMYIQRDASNRAAAEIYTPDVGYQGVSVGFFLKRVGNPSGNVFAEIRDVSSLQPNSVLATSALKSAATIPTSYAWEWFDFSPSLQLDAGVEYAIVAWGDFGLSAVNHIEVGTEGLSGSHPGRATVCDTAGCNTPSDWSNVATTDVLFQVIGSQLYSSLAVPISGSHDVMEVATGSLSSYGINTEGKVLSWGDNTFGQLGDNSITNRSTPVSTVGRHSFIHITGGGRSTQGHACALKGDGTVWCWGDNTFGQLGLCDQVNRSSPSSVIGDHSFVDVRVSQGGFNTIAIKADGTVWVWGKEPFCDAVNYCSPIQFPNFNLILLNILGRGYFEDFSNILRIT